MICIIIYNWNVEIVSFVSSAASFNDDIIPLEAASFPFWLIPLSFFVAFIILFSFIFMGMMLCHHKIQKEGDAEYFCSSLLVDCFFPFHS